MKRVLFAVMLLVVGALSTGATVSAQETSHPGASVFVARLNAAQEVQTPPVVSQATGRGVFVISERDTKIRFELSSRGLGRITQAHIHLAPRGQNGAVVLFLFPLSAKGVNGENWSVSGTLTADDIVQPPAPAPPLTFAQIVAAIKAGNAYANIHTVIHPAGEIRGQLEQRGVDD
jgi:hypothetical protein